MLKIELLGLSQLKVSFEKMPVVVQDRLRIFIARFTLMVRDQVKINIRERFHVVQGIFPDAVQSEQTETVGTVQGRVYIDTLPWAAIQEYGGTTPPHTILPVNANVLAFMMPGRLGFSGGPKSNALAFAKQVNHPGADIPERTYMRLALVQTRAPFENGIREVVSGGFI
jgi:hypothetical protein